MGSKKCKCAQESSAIRFEADSAAEPFWCDRCGRNLAMMDFGLSEAFIEEIYQWLSRYIEWIDLETDTLVEGAEEMQQRFNEQGFILYEKFKNMMGDKLTVTYKPANSVSSYKTMHQE